MLHRGENGPDYEGDCLDAAVWREAARGGDRRVRAPGTREEAGLAAPLQPVAAGPESWRIYVAEVAGSARVQLHDPKHDHFIWTDPEHAVRACLPEVVQEGLSLAIRRIAAAMGRR